MIKVDITIVNLENAHLGDINPILNKFMIDQGYSIVDEVGGQDIIFVKNGAKISQKYFFLILSFEKKWQ